MRDKIGDRPIEVTESNGNLILKFYPMTKNAKKSKQSSLLSHYVPWSS